VTSLTIDLDATAIDMIHPIHLPDGLMIDDRGPAIALKHSGRRVSLRWGQAHQLGTCAYWSDQARFYEQPRTLAIGDTLREEIAACILGGYGIPAEMGLAAFHLLRKKGLLADEARPTQRELEVLLHEELALPSNHGRRYRFARQRAERLALAMSIETRSAGTLSALELRTWLMAIPGVGPKTASWIVRNHLGSREVAIIDVHVRRAGLRAGFFDPAWRLPRQYSLFEGTFLAVSRLAGSSPVVLDMCIWDRLRSTRGPSSRLLG
jgi:N-glycosylase/DNA lyase